MTEIGAVLDALRVAVDEGRAPGVDVRRDLAGIHDPTALRTAGRLLAGLATDGGELRRVRVAVLATCTIGSFEHLLRASLVAAGALPAIEPADYGSFEVSLASASFAADGDPDVVVCLMEESYFLPSDPNGYDETAMGGHVQARLDDLHALVKSSLRRTSATVVLHTIPLPGAVRDSFISVRARAAVSRIWHQLNAGILGLAEEHRQVVVVDLVSALADSACEARDDRLHRYADLPYTDGALLVLANEVRRVVQARLGLSRKVLAIDLDNTLWGGVIGEVGAHGVQLGGLYPGNCYLQLQRSVAHLRQQGVVLALVSKNDPELAEEALTQHPDVVLRPDAFSVRAVNWSPKVDNLRRAAESLSLSLPSFVFMDDSAFERGHVSTELPEVAVVDASGDPAHLVRSLLRHGWFDVMELTETDRQRPTLYRTRAMRSDFSANFGSSEEYLRALGTALQAQWATPFTVARVAQLAARTNQFNLTATVFDEATTAAMSTDPDHRVAVFSVSDRFGDEGIVGAAWIEAGPRTWRVLNLVLSCRVLGRGVELAMADWIVTQARVAGAVAIEGRYVRTRKNGVASAFWTEAGFTPSGADGVFTLAPGSAAVNTPDWISTKETESHVT